MKITNEFLMEGATSIGGWNKEQFAILGLPSHPKSGWKSRIIGNEISPEDYEKFLKLRGWKHVKKSARSTISQLDLL